MGVAALTKLEKRWAGPDPHPEKTDDHQELFTSKLFTSPSQVPCQDSSSATSAS